MKNFILAFLVGAVLIFASSVNAKILGNRYVKNHSDFETHVLLHRMRVLRLGLAIRNIWSEKFGSLSDIEIYEFLSLHDFSKWFDSPEFRAEFWPQTSRNQPYSFSQRFFEFYGKQIDYMLGDEKVRFKQLIDDLNQSDSAVVSRFFEKQPRLRAIDGKPSPRAVLLLELERLADLADRDSDPVAAEEMGLVTKKPLERYVNDPEELGLLVEIRGDYLNIVQGLNFTDSCGLGPILGEALLGLAPKKLGL